MVALHLRMTSIKYIEILLLGNLMTKDLFALYCFILLEIDEYFG